MTHRLPPRDLAHELTVAQLRQQAHFYRLAARESAQLAEEADVRASRMARDAADVEAAQMQADRELMGDVGRARRTG